MKKSSFAFVGSIVFAILLALAPLLLGKVILHAYALKTGTTELEAVASRYLMRAERVLSEAVGLLRDVDRSQIHNCSGLDQVRLSEMIARSTFVRRIGFVDDNGFPQCLVPTSAVHRGAMMVDAADTTRQVTLAVSDKDSAPDLPEGTVFVGWKSVSGARLIAEVSVGALDIDAGPEYFRDRRYVEVLVGGGYRWFSAGRQSDLSAADPNAITAKARSEVFPVEVRARVDAESAYTNVRTLDLTLAVSCTALACLFVGVAIWINWRPDQATHDEFVMGLIRNEFVPYYQPVMNIDTGQIEGCELLVRWVKSDGTVVSPGAFMQYAETSGHVFEMTRAVMRQSVKDLGGLYANRLNLKLSINLFAGHFNDRKVIDDIEGIFGGGPIAYEQLVFEVTERYPLSDIERARKIIAEMHSLGCRVALDDTGTGHGGLAYLQQLGIDIVKIDKMFIDAMGSDLGASTIIDVLVELANSLGMGVVAEGVEREEQIQRLRDKGITSAQGYIFAPPLPANLFVELAGALVSDGPIPFDPLADAA
ncbi:MAG: EAL domain-containing protein [Ancalomicrobiaceae bacterium]|nr:EAL domain-containing protein [Ancalomicrobiaceae bacterium]